MLSKRTHASAFGAHRISTAPVRSLYLPLALDYGTKHLSAAYLQPGSDEEIIYDAWFSTKCLEAPQRAAWLENGDFIWGHGVDDALGAGLVSWRDVVELWKLAIYKDHKTDPVAQQVVTQLARLGKGRVSNLISVHLAAVIKEVRRIVKRNPGVSQNINVDRIPIKLFLNAPQQWKPAANRVMTEAAKAAGIHLVELVYEQQSAVGSYADFLYRHQPDKLQPGDVSIVADVGGGTSDFVSYEIGEGGHTGARVPLEIVGTPMGSLCGSEFVNLNFLKWLRKRPGFSLECNRLGVDEIDILKEAFRQFESLKHNFTGPHSPRPHVLILPDPDRDTAPWTILFTNSDMESFFKSVIEEMIRCIDLQWRPRAKTMFTPGGFGKSPHLRKVLAAWNEGRLLVYGQNDMDRIIDNAIPQGTFMRYGKPSLRGLVSPVSFGIGRTEDWDPEIHHDATYETGQRMANGRINADVACPKRDIVTKDSLDPGREVVHERWCCLLQKGTEVYPGSRHSTENWQYYAVSPRQKTISVQVYCTELDIREHDPILDGEIPKEEIETWGAPLEMKLPDLAAEGFDLRCFSRKRKWYRYEIFCRLVLECNGANVSVRWQIAKPGTQPYDENGESRTSTVKLATDEYFELCGEAFNPLPRTGVS